MNTPKRLALIPARAGSKGIINKNLVLLDGIPLVEWSIRVAVASCYFNTVCVSTNSSQIKLIAELAGAEVPFIRPDEYSGDKSLQYDVIRHCLEYYKSNGRTFDSVTLLQPTSPFRKIEDLINTNELFMNSKCETLISVKDVSEISESTCYESYTVDSLLKLLPITLPNNYNKLGSLRQDFSKKYWRNGSIYIFKSQNIFEGNVLIKDPIVGYEMPWYRSINIDSNSDLELARILAECKHSKVTIY